jgi:HEAT repeat protein
VIPLVVGLSRLMCPLVADLGHDDWHRREAAVAACRGAGLLALPALLAAADDRDPEVRRRAAELLAPHRVGPQWGLAAAWLLAGPEDVAHGEVRWLLDHPAALEPLAVMARGRGLWVGPMAWECDRAWFPADVAVGNALRAMRQRALRGPERP